jgi:hypothetical protein
MEDWPGRAISAAKPEKVTAMSRKSVIQLVPAPTGCGDASDLRYRLLMAALGSSDEANPLLAVPGAIDPSPHTVAESPAGSEQDVPLAEARAVERMTVAEFEGQAIPLSVVRAQAPSPVSAHKAATEASAPAGDEPVSRPSKRR